MTPRRLIEPARLAGTALLHTQTDERLVDLTRAGNARAFEAIVARYRKQLLRYCAGILPPERAEDAVQQAFLNAYKAIVAGEADLRLRPWLYRIAHNSALNLLRQNGWSYDQIPEDFDGVMQPPQAVEQSERIRAVVRSVQELPERQRNAIVLRELEGRSYDEIAVALGVSDGAVRQLLNRARTTLRAAATSITPPQLIERVAERAAVDAPAAARIAEISVAGAGGAMTLAKFGTVIVVAGAIAGGVNGGPFHHSHHHGAGDDIVAGAHAALGGAGGAGGRSGDGPGGHHGAAGAHGRRGRGAAGPGGGLARALELARDERRRHGDDPGGDRHGGDDGGFGEDNHGGSSGSDGGGEHSGPGDGSTSGDGHDGSGSGDSGDGGSSGSSSGSGDSGSGSGDSGSSGSSGSGSGDSGSSGSGSGSSFESGSSNSGPGSVEDDLSHSGPG